MSPLTYCSTALPFYLSHTFSLSSLNFQTWPALILSVFFVWSVFHQKLWRPRFSSIRCVENIPQIDESEWQQNFKECHWVYIEICVAFSLYNPSCICSGLFAYHCESYMNLISLVSWLPLLLLISHLVLLFLCLFFVNLLISSGLSLYFCFAFFI